MVGSTAAENVALVHKNCAKYYRKTIKSDGTFSYEEDMTRPNDPELKESFMLELPITDAASPINDCAVAVNELVKRGVVAQTCGKYFVSTTDPDKDPERKGWSYDLKFVPCQ
jgi:hypothetical protein